MTKDGKPNKNTCTLDRTKMMYKYTIPIEYCQV